MELFNCYIMDHGPCSIMSRDAQNDIVLFLKKMCVATQ